MKMKLTNTWKKRLLCLAALICCLAILATGTAANFVVEETAYNVITTGLLYMELVEETTGGQPWPEEGFADVIPGRVIDKLAKVHNNGAVPFFCKVTVTGTVKAYEGGELPFDPITLDYDTEHWILKGESYYYYRILYPGEVTEPLFTKVSFDPTMGNEYMRAKVNINVLAQAVQSDNNGTDPLEALGWSEAAKTVIDAIDETTEPAEAV